MPDPLHMHPDAVLSHMDWVRRLALKLAKDPHLADDLVQATCMAALERPPSHQDNLRGWLGKIVQNCFRQFIRHDSRYQKLKAQARQGRSPLPPDELLSRAQVQQRVAQAALGLPEHYRSALLLRYFEGLTPPQIAAHLDVPLATVKSRLSRALRILRDELDELHDQDRSRWLLALIPMKPVAGTVAMKLKVAMAASLVVAIPFAWPTLFPSDLDLDPVTRPAESQGVLTAAPETGKPAAPAESGQRVELADVSALLDFATAIPLGKCRGLVLGPDGKRRAGVRVQVEGDIEAAQATSDADGVFELPRPNRIARIVAASRDLVTIVGGYLNPNDPVGKAGKPVLVVAPVTSAKGDVVAEDGSTLSGVDVEYLLPKGFRERFHQVLDYTLIHRFRHVTTDTLGRFLGTGYARARGAHLRFRKPGFLPVVKPLPADDEVLKVVLRRPTANDGIITGVVLSQDGYPVAGARILLGRAESVSDSSGRFAVVTKQAAGCRELFALKSGHLPAHKRLAENPGHVELRLGPAPKTIRGRVVDEEGRPMSDMFVWPQAPTVCGITKAGIATTEALLSGTRLIGWGYVVTDGDGNFVCKGLFARDYKLSVMHAGSMRTIQVGPVAAGTDDLEVEFPPDGVLPLVAGKVLSPDGKPLAGVSVMASRDVIQLDAGNGRLAIVRNGSRLVVTDEKGYFEMRHVAKERIYLHISGNGIMNTNYGPRDLGFLAITDRRADDLRIVVHLKMEMRVETSRSFADAFVVLDGAGKPLRMLHVLWKDSQSHNTRFAIKDGKSPVVSLADTARTIVFFLKGKEVARQSLQLVPGRVNVIRR